MTLSLAQRNPAATAYRLLAGESVHLAPTARQPVDYARVLGEHRLLYCGESHWDLGAKADLTTALPTLRQAGISHLGIEMYFADRDTQAVLDAHFDRRDTTSLHALRQRLYYFGHQYGCAPAYERLVTTAIAHGIRVVGINGYPTQRGLANAAWAATIADVLAGSSDISRTKRTLTCVTSSGSGACSGRGCRSSDGGHEVHLHNIIGHRKKSCAEKNRAVPVSAAASHHPSKRGSPSMRVKTLSRLHKA